MSLAQQFLTWMSAGDPSASFNLLFNQAEHAIEDTTDSFLTAHERDLNLLNQQIQREQDEKKLLVLKTIKDVMLIYKNEEDIAITMDEAKEILRTELMREFKQNDMESNEACTTIEKGDVGLGNNPQHKPKTQCLVALEKIKRKKPSYYLFKKALLLQKIRDIMREDPEIARWKDIKMKLAEFFFPMWWDLPKDHELKLEINNVIENEFRKRHEESETPAGETKRRGGRKKKRKTRKRKRKSKKKKSKKKTRKKRKTKRKKGGAPIDSKKSSKEEEVKKEEKKTTPEQEPAKKEPEPTEEPIQEPIEEPAPTQEPTQETPTSTQEQTEEEPAEETETETEQEKAAEPLAEQNVPAEDDIAAAEATPNELYQQLVDILSPSLPNLSVETIGIMIDDFFQNADLESVTADDITNYIIEQSSRQSPAP